jgi:HTH-like domain/Integrase core domain
VACRVLNVSRSGFYEWLSRLDSPRCQENELLLKQIREIHEESRGTYGSPRIHAELTLGLGLPVNLKRIARLMREAGIQGLYRRRRRGCTVRDRDAQPATDLVNRQFTVDAPNRLWITDITEHPTMEGKVYCAAVMDAYSRLIVGWSIAEHMRTELVTDALGMAIIRRRPEKRAEDARTILHSDHGSQLGLNRSSQHLDREVCYGTRARLGCGNDGQAAHAVTGSSAGRSQGTSKIVLEGNLPRSDKHGCGAHGRRVGGRRHPVVPRMWRSEALGGFPCGFGPVPVARRA